MCIQWTPSFFRVRTRPIPLTVIDCLQLTTCRCSRSRRPDTTMAWNFRDSFRTSPIAGGGESWIALPEYFKNAGFDTRGSGKTYHEGSPSPAFDIPRSWAPDHYLPPHYPPEYGNGLYLVCCRQPYNATEGCVDQGNSGGGFCRVANESAIFDYVQASHTISLLRQWHANNSHTPNPQPFFYAVGWKLPHAPFGSPPRTYDLYEPVDQLALAANQHPPEGVPDVALITDFFVRLEGNSTSFGYDWGPDTPAPAFAARRNRQAYYAAVSYIDEQIGRVLATLAELNLEESTIVVMHADVSVPKPHCERFARRGGD